VNFLRRLALQEKETLTKNRVSMLLKPRVSLTCFRAYCFPDWAMDLSATRYKFIVTLKMLHSSKIHTRGADKFLARPGRKQARKHVRDARDFNNIETRALIEFFFLQGKAPKEIHAILTETLACFLTGWAKDLSTPL